MSNDLVAFSRAGDVFHYRWAARRSLHLIYPNHTLRSLYIEGSKEIEKAGEYVIDVAEYHDLEIGKTIDYYQLKHSEVQVNDPFTLSDLEDTVKGFTRRFLQHFGTGVDSLIYARIRFIILTNRAVDQDFIKNIRLLGNGETVTKRFKDTIEKYSALQADQLRSFCAMFEFQDGEGNYLVQREELRTEIAQLIAGSVDNPQIESLVAMIQHKVLPNANHEVLREEVLQKFGITFEKELYPAPAIWEKENLIISRQQHQEIKEKILKQTGPFIVHAGGGVGKSVFTRQLVSGLEEGSVAIAYDCFGAGSYRNRSTTRHRHKDALVQIINELATKGLCNPILPTGNDSDENLMKTFVNRVEATLCALKKNEPLAKLVVIVDAADNAEMAAVEFNQSCFAHEIIREQYPDDFRLVVLCRTERISLLQPLSNVIQLELLPFSEEESTVNLQSNFPEASELDGKEFHRLTSGNPRVQANALDLQRENVAALLISLGPGGVTVEEQIKQQLTLAINRIKDLLPNQFAIDINSICVGLASLPPHIPIEILAAAASVKPEYIKSFVADIGRSLWLLDNSVQFRDEPTETWFRQTYTATKDDYGDYIKRLEPLAISMTYVAESLPMLYLQAEQYEKLILIALSDAYLPKHNPIDERNVRVYRLKFAFQAALKLKNYSDAIKLSMRAGEEVAGDRRQLHLFKENVDLLATLQNQEKVQQIAYRRSLSGSWPGSENIYSASILSFIPDYKGDASGYIRSAKNWLAIYFKDFKEKTKARAKSKKQHDFDHNHQNEVQNEDVLELAFAILNVNGADECFEFLISLRPRNLVATIIGRIADRLIDHGRNDDIRLITKKCVDIPEFLVAIVDQMLAVGRFPEREDLEPTLKLLNNKKTRIKQPEYHWQDSSMDSGIVSFLEACLHHDLPAKIILRVLNHYIPEQISKDRISIHHSEIKVNFVKALAIRKALGINFETDIEKLLPDTVKTSEQTPRQKDDLKEFKEVILGLFPWFDLRAKIITGEVKDLTAGAAAASKKSASATSSRHRNYDFIPGELVSIRISIITLYTTGNENEVNEFYNNHISNAKDYNINQVLDFTKIVFRAAHLKILKIDLEKEALKYIKLLSDSGPEEIAGRYVKLARAIQISSTDDASVYFDEAINVISKFGDEIVSRWDAISTLGRWSSSAQNVKPETAYQFIRCSEVVGNNLREKHWDRETALQICVKLSPSVGIAALSRWRDRRIGYFDYLLSSAIKDLVDLKLLSPGISWGLHKLQAISLSIELLIFHLDRIADDAQLKQLIFNDAVQVFGKQGHLINYISSLETLAKQHHFTFDNEAEKIIRDYQFTLTDPIEKELDKSANKEIKIDWKLIFGKQDLLIVANLEACYNKFREVAGTWRFDTLQEFWVNVFDRVTENDLWQIIDTFLSTEFVRYSDLALFFNSFPEHWKNKASFKRKWPELVKRFGEQFAYDLHTSYIFRPFARDLKLTETEIIILKEGIFSRMAQASDHDDAEMFFNFVSLACSFLQPADTVPLLEYALDRFAIHIEPDFADGIWDNWLLPSDNLNQDIAGLIWSNLGSPWTAERWRSLHVLSWLPAVNSKPIFNQLFEWMAKGTVGAYGSKDYIFYNLHARLYFLIGCTKIAANSPGYLLPYKDIFIKYALEPHAVIQKLCVEIINNIERSFPATFDPANLMLVQGLVTSQFPVKKVHYNYHIDSPWHENKDLPPLAEFFFGIDFPQYWYEPLGEVFGVPRDQVCELVKDVLFNHWKIEIKNGYKNDPRMGLWNTASEERETWHDHGSYPKADTLDFYYSYHGMFVVASNLLQKLPILDKHDYEENKWEYWLTQHALTYDNGRWLSDYKDIAPLKRPGWVTQPRDNEWKDKISESDLLDLFTTDEQGELWLYVAGSWHEISDNQKEHCHVATALVNRATSNALLNAYTTCDDPHDYKVPDYKERNFEINQGKFRLKGWLYFKEMDKGIDQFDPAAKGLTMPFGSVGEQLQSTFSLSTSKSGKSYFSNGNASPSVVSEIYSTDVASYGDEEAAQEGNRIKASLTFLKHLCQQQNSDLIFKMHVSRNLAHRSRSYNSERNTDNFKIYLLSSDGTIRDANRNYQLG
jgi:hypothetical protein